MISWFVRIASIALICAVAMFGTIHARQTEDAAGGQQIEKSVTATKVEASTTQRDQFFKLALWVLLGALILLMGLGVSNRVVVFYDIKDAWWSISPLFFLVGAFVVSISLAPEGTKEFASTPVEKAVLALGILGSLVGIIITFYNAMLYNRSIFLGFVVGTGKTIVSVLLAITFIGSFNGAYSSKNTRREAALPALVLLLVGVLWAALVNGDRVYARKNWAAP